MRLTVGIPVKDHLDLTKAVVENCRDVGGYDRLLIFDNGSTDGTQAWLAEQDDLTWYDRAGANLYRMWNEMRDFSAGDTAILNNDISFDAGFFADLHGALHAEDDIAIAYPANAPAPGGEPVTTKLFAGYAFLTRNQHKAMPRFEEGYLWWYGDTDYAAALEAAGLRCVCVPTVEVRHLESASTPEGLVESTVGHDRALFERKWGDWLAR